MALKLGKCRLCLKLGDFYSIWAADGGVRLADMAMALASLKIYEGDGLPDKVCSECVEKLSCAYIFKLQCERADQDLRRNYIPPPGFSHTPPPPNRQSSDSGYSHRTDVSIQPKHVPQPEEPAVASSSKRKRKRKADDFGRNTSLLQESFSMNLASPAQSDHSRPKTPDKKPRYEEDSDYEYTGAATADSDFEGDPNEHKCPKCDKQFQSKKSLSQHYRIHKREEKQNESNSSLQENVVVDIPQGEDDGLGCSTCGKTFKLQIMLKRHILSCQDNPAEDQISETEQGKLTCKYCHMKFKANANLAKHMRVVHAAVLKEDTPKGNKIAMVPCLHCDTIFIEFEAYKKHFDFCPRRKNVKSYACKACDKDFPVRSTYIRHIKLVHFGIRVPRMNESSSFVADDAEQASFDCRICSRKLATQDQLVAHLAAHMSNMDTDESRGSTLDESSQNSNFSLKSCPHCDRVFKYNKSLETHIIVQHSRQSLEVKVEPELPFMNETNIESDGDDSSQGDNDNTCDICEKIFSYKKTLEHHKRTKHNSTSGMKRSKINVRKCKVTCLICNISMQVFELKVHNQMHIDEKVKPKNLYSCSECSNTFSCVSALSGHIKLVHRLNQQMPDGAGYEVTNVANFCEVVVTKSEPLDTVQSHNDDTTVPRKLVLQPVVDLSGFTCPLCSKKMGNLLSLKRHINWHNNKGNSMMKKLDCKICDMTFKFDSHYKLHMKDHYYDLNLDPKFLTCTICNRVSKHLRAAQAHNNWHKQTRFNTKDYQCSICKKIFQYRRVYLYHMAVHYKKGDSIEKTKDLPIEAGSGNGDSHKCPHCQKVLDSANSLKCHMAWHRSKSSLYGSRYECDLCKTQFTNKRRHELHLRTHYEDENGPFKCPICSKGYNEENFFQRHVKSHNFDRQDQVKRKQRVQEIRDKKVKCPICCRYYPDLAKLIGHLKRSHPESKMVKPDPDAEVQKSHFSCKLCAKIFFNEKRLQFHEESHLRKPTHYKCKFCGKKAASLKMHNVHVKGHLTKNYHDDPLKCPHCEEKFVRGYALHHHIMDVHGIRENWIAERSTERVLGPLKELQCDVCLKILASKGNYERHIDYHNTLRCNYCFEFFNGRVFLDGHLAYSCEKKKLIGETEVYPKKVKCNVCYKAFHLQIKLDCHLHTQHGVKLSDKTFESKQEHVCDYCFRVFENEEALTGHKIYHRSVGFYGCIYCKRKFNSVTTYNKHKNHHFYQLHEEDPVKCEHCDERFVVFKEMIHHMRDEHGDNKEWITMPKETVEEECDICHKRFDNLPRHLRYHQENRCKKCREYFFSRTDYDQHMCAIESDEEDVLTQDGEEKPAYSECTFCFKPITGKKMTKIFHDRIHSISHKISCRLCPAKFKTVEAFNIHAFSHRSRKYKKNPLTCPLCKEKFVQYGPFVKHMRGVHDVHDKMHYRATVLPDECVVCRGVFPNLHNHYRAHLQHACFACKKYFTSQKLFMAHSCDKEDADPTKVFTCDENLYTLINNYVPREENYEAKYYGKTDEEDSAEINGENDSKEPKESNCAEELKGQQGSSAGAQQFDHAPIIISKVLSLHKVQGKNETGSRVSNGSVNDNGDDCIVICDDDNEPSIDPVTINLDD